jgi:hypothetical protein
LEKDPSERYQTAGDLKADLRRLKRGLFSGVITATKPGQAAEKPAAKIDHVANFFTWQEDIILQMAGILRVKMLPHSQSLLAADSTTIPGAFESYSISSRGLSIKPKTCLSWSQKSAPATFSVSTTSALPTSSRERMTEPRAYSRDPSPSRGMPML